MNGLRLLPLLLMTSVCSAQSLTGTIRDSRSGKYLAGVSIRVSSQTVLSDADGGFSLSGIRVGDTIDFSYIGYRPRNYAVYKLPNDKLAILMEPTTIMLNEVGVSAFRNYGVDSLKFRKEFAEIFNYGKPKIMDIFIPKVYMSNEPRPYFKANNSTASLISIDLLSTIALLRKNEAPQSKLQEKLIKEEEERHIDHAFSKRLIRELTGLDGDSLKSFILLYRPTVESARTLSEYDIMMYIKKSFDEFMNKGDYPPRGHKEW